MDPNGLRFWLLAEERDWTLENWARYDEGCRRLTLKSQREVAISEVAARAESLLQVVPQATDQLGTYAYFDSVQRQLLATGAAPGTEVLLDVGTDELTDVTVSSDGVLFLALNGAVHLRDLRERWTALALGDVALRAFRLASQPGGGVLVLDRVGRAIWRVSGLPFPELGVRTVAPDVFRPSPENANQPRLQRVTSIAPVLDPIAIATSSRASTLVLSWSGTEDAFVQRLDADGNLSTPRRLLGVKRPFSIGFLDSERFVVLVAAATGAEAIPYSFTVTQTDFAPEGGIYPLAHYVDGPFAHTALEPVRYPSRTPGATIFAHPRPLVRLSAPELAPTGSGANKHPIDGGRPQFIWHRLYIEALLPEQCGVRVWLAATERPTRPAAEEFHLHVFGEIGADPGTPRGVWSPHASELPHHPGLLEQALEPHRVGLFSVLIQRRGRKVSTVCGRYLWLRVELVGNGRSAPELAALRVYGSRFSYAQRYLPSCYQEQLFAPDSDAVSEQTTPQDFLERMLLNFEGILTPLEDRIANAHLLTHPSSAPPEALDWLGQWVGLTFDPAYPRDAQRRALSSAAALHRYRGTHRGLSLALDIVTNDGVQRGETLVIEDFRLRRTFATILGADLADEDDPLLAGLVRSGNSFVGDSLILSREFQYEFVAVFRESLPEPPRGFSRDEWVNYVFQHFVGSALIDDFFERQANRVTVLVRQETSSDRVRLIQRVLELEAPAHLATEVVRASQPFIIGLASLVGVDTFLRDPVPPPTLRVDETQLGGSAFLRSSASLDPRLEGGGS